MKKPKFHIVRNPKAKQQWFFNLHAPNGEKILQSEMYKTKAAAHKACLLIKNYAPSAEIIDESFARGEKI